jgi:hypothetical protein
MTLPVELAVKDETEELKCRCEGKNAVPLKQAGVMM